MGIVLPEVCIERQKQFDKEARVKIVNQIIAEIASRGRRFFHNKDQVAYLFLRNNKIWYKCEWVSDHRPVEEICFSVKKNGRMANWFHGGTLESLIRDFCDFVRTGEYSNHNQGYGGLYCQHWGYSAEDMRAIQEKAVELGYLRSPTTDKADKQQGNV
ncbi:hypothetical protein [Pedobacter cryoconitis]|uniref:Uncharacterized protein n=1 Tax=Pedobacter cryoconitis TaxID=188932 RepID=A0A327SK55_9SPHI|nr:hypothetical protein [Pedobacter cryoconitis]RAJ28895.1 hypothetical protein LY11_03169 [Pedobacter cryoconitis]